MKIKNNQSGIGLLGVIILFVVLLGVGLLANFILNAKSGARSFADTYNSAMNDVSAQEAYQTLQCPEFQSRISLTQFAQFQSSYRQLSSDEISFDVKDTKIDASKLLDDSSKNLSGVYATVSVVYRMPGLDVGLALKKSGDSFCVLGTMLQPR